MRHERSADKPLQSSDRVICVADVHGNLTQLKALWAALTTHLGGEAELRRTRVSFSLGTIATEGPTRAVCSIGSSR